MHARTFGAPMCSFKRSPPLTEIEAQILQEETSLFGYRPEVLEKDGTFHLKIRGDGTDDAVFNARLAQLRRPKWNLETSPSITQASPMMARK